MVEKHELEERAKSIITELSGTKYDLVANIVHDSPPGQEMKEPKKGEEGPPGTFRVHVFNRVSTCDDGSGLELCYELCIHTIHIQASDQWYEIQDLHVQETLPQLITISESCVLIYEKKGAVENINRVD